MLRNSHPWSNKVSSKFKFLLLTSPVKCAILYDQSKCPGNHRWLSYQYNRGMCQDLCPFVLPIWNPNNAWSGHKRG